MAIARGSFRIVQDGWRSSSGRAFWLLVTACSSCGVAWGDSGQPAIGPTPILVAQTPPKPTSRESLFGDDLPPVKQKAPASSRESLFGDDPPKAKQPETPSKKDLFGEVAPKDASAFGGWRGYIQSNLAYMYDSPEHWSNVRGRLELGRQGSLSDSVKYKATGRVSYDFVFDVEQGFYPSDVRKNRRHEFDVRETYVDVAPGGNWEFRLGRQQIVWGEVPGLFFADVVSAKDLREFVLPEFDSIRIPQWAARAEYFGSKFHVEAIWIPWPTIDRIGKPGDDYYPYPPPTSGFVQSFKAEQKPSRTLGNSNFGGRISTLVDGWDLSGFVYRAFDNEATFYRDVVNGAVPTFVYSPQHKRITQFGGTATKDLGFAVLKTEIVNTQGRYFSVQGIADGDGVAKLDHVDYLVGLDSPLTRDASLYTYFFQRHFTKYQDDVVPDRTESGLTAVLTYKASRSVELQALAITSLNRNDWMFRPKLTWNFARNWRMNVGADILHGPPLGYFGQYASKDRVYADLRYSF